MTLSRVVGSVHRHGNFLSVLLPALAVACFSLISSLRRPLWRDEFATWSFASLNIDDLPRAVSHVDAVLAPYYFLVHYVYSAIPNDFGLRLLSIVAAATAVLFLSMLALRWWGPVPAFVAGMLLALNPLFFQMAATARPYALATMFVAMSAYFLVKAISPGPQVFAWIGYGIALSGAGLMHLMALLAIVATSVLVIGINKTKVLTWLSTSIIAAVFIVPIAAAAFSQRGQVSWIPLPNYRSIIGSLASLIVFTKDGRLTWFEALALVLVFIVLAGGVLLLIKRFKGAMRCLEMKRFSFTLIVFLFPWLFLTGESLLATPFLRTTYLLPSVLGLSLALAAVAHYCFTDTGPNKTARSSTSARPRKSRRWPAAGLAVITAAIFVLSGATTANALRASWWVDDFPGLASALSTKLSVGDSVIFIQHYSETGVNAGIAYGTHDVSFANTLQANLIAGTQPVIEFRRVVSIDPLVTVESTDSSSSSPMYVIYTRGGFGPVEIRELAALKITCSEIPVAESSQSFGLLRLDSGRCTQEE